MIIPNIVHSSKRSISRLALNIKTLFSALIKTPSLSYLQVIEPSDNSYSDVNSIIINMGLEHNESFIVSIAKIVASIETILG